MDIVDAQLHANMLATEVAPVIMDALGIHAVLFDEFDKATDDGALHPEHRLADSSFRREDPNAEAAALRYPDRFASMVRLDTLNPGLECWIDTRTPAPGFKALRILVRTPTDGAVFENGGHDQMLSAAGAHNLPVFIACPVGSQPWASMPSAFRMSDSSSTSCGAALDLHAAKPQLTRLSRWPTYKWSHAASR